MKKIALLFCAVFMLLAPSVSLEARSVGASKVSGVVNPLEDTVYVTNTGTKYHKSTCRHLAKSKIAMKKSEAIKKGYTACTVCKP